MHYHNDLKNYERCSQQNPWGVVKKKKRSREEQEQTWEVASGLSNLPCSCHWGCYHGSEVPGNRPLQPNSLPSPRIHPTKPTQPLSWKDLVETIKIMQFLADFAIGSTGKIPWARLSSSGRTGGVATMATQFPCPFILSVSWGRSLEEVVPHLLHQGREIAKDTQMERRLRECSI